MRHRLAVAVFALAVAGALVPGALAAGPDLGTVAALNTDKLTYTTAVSGNETTLSVRPAAGAEALREVKIPGKWGIPLVTFNGLAGGLSHDGHRLVLAMASGQGQPLRVKSGFVTVDAGTLKVLR